MKRPDFKYVIFKIIEVARGNPPAKQHSRFGLNRLCCLADRFHGDTSTILKITYLKSGRFKDKNDVLHVFVASVSIFWSLKSGVDK